LKGVAGTGFLVAFANRGDRHHDWAVTIAGRAGKRGLDCPIGL